MKKVCKELIDFFEQQQGWDKNEIMSDWAAEVLQDLNCTLPNSSIPIAMDEIELCWGEDSLSTTLQDFAEKLFDKILVGVCNVIRTA